MFGIDDALIAGGMSLVGGLFGNSAKASQAEKANDFSAKQYASRWQTTTADMKAAGLNPMLSYSQGVGSSPTGQQAQQDDVITPAVHAGFQSRMQSAQAANIAADTANKEAQGELFRAQAAAALSSAGQAESQSRLNEANVNRIVEEIKNIPTEGERLKELVRNLIMDTSLKASQAGESASRQLLNMQNLPLVRAQIQEIMARTDLLNMDLDSLKRLDGLGNDAKAAKPIFDIIRGIISSDKGR